MLRIDFALEGGPRARVVCVQRSLYLNLKIDIYILKNPGGSQQSCERVF